MKKTNVTVQFDDEKMNAIRIYAGRKDASVEDELADCLQRFYEKHVPKDTREYIDLMSAEQPAKPKPRATKPGTSAPKPASPAQGSAAPTPQPKPDAPAGPGGSKS